MYPRANFAFSKTVTSLHGVLGTGNEREFLLAFAVTLAGFGAIQFALDHNSTEVYAPIAAGFAEATMFFFTTVGFITFISTLYVFAYYLTVGRPAPVITGYGRGWRIVLSFAISGLVTAAAFNLFYEGLTAIQFEGMQYVSLP